MPSKTTAAKAAAMLKDRQVEEWPIDRVKPYAKNPRTHSDAQVAKIARSLEEYGWTNPILVAEDDEIIAGHGRHQAALSLGYKTVRVIVLAGLTRAQRRAYVLADNRLAEEAGWDDDLLASELRALGEEEEDFDLALTGFEADEIEALLAEKDSNTGGSQDPDAVPTPPAVPTSMTGDVWLLGRHRVLCGDATSEKDMALLMDGGLANCLWSDPPYNVAYEGTAGKIENDDMDDASFAGFLAAAFGLAAAALRPGAAAYVAHADTEGLNFRKAFAEAGFKLSGCLVWRKNSLVLGRSDYQWQHEPILYGWKKGAAHNWFGDRKQTTVIDCDKPARNEHHPTMKPVALIEPMLKNSTKAGHVVLDPFGGSGSTLIACEHTARTARLLELEPRFVDVIVKRWQEFAGKEATLAGTERTFAEVASERNGPADDDSQPT